MTQKIHKCDTEIASSTKISLCQKFPSLKFKLRKMHTQIRMQKNKHTSEQNIILMIFGDIRKYFSEITIH